MISKLEQDALFKIRKEIGGLLNSGGDYTTAEAFDSAVRKHQLTREQAEELDLILIKSIHDYRGRYRP